MLARGVGGIYVYVHVHVCKYGALQIILINNPDVGDCEVSSASSVSIKASTPVTISPHTFESCI